MVGIEIIFKDLLNIKKILRGFLVNLFLLEVMTSILNSLQQVRDPLSQQGEHTQKKTSVIQDRRLRPLFCRFFFLPTFVNVSTFEIATIYKTFHGVEGKNDHLVLCTCSIT